MVATRLYPATGTAPFSFTASGWNAVGLMTRENLSAVVGDYTDNGTPATVGSGVAGDNTCVFQSYYGPLAAQTITGNFNGQIGAREASTATDARIQCKVRVIAPDGTVRGILRDIDATALAFEFNVSASVRLNRKVPLGAPAALTSCVVTAGDYLVIETGFKNHGTNTGAVRMGHLGTTANGDLPVDETTDVSNYRMWYEFDTTISLYVATVGRSWGYVL